jgi:hypothetical protein
MTLLLLTGGGGTYVALFSTAYCNLSAKHENDPKKVGKGAHMQKQHSGCEALVVHSGSGTLQ